MPKTSSRFTDHNLKLLYGNLLNHYQDCTQRHQQDALAIYDEMYRAV